MGTGELRAEAARLAAGGAWNLQQWGSMARYVAAMRPDTVETAFFKAVMATHDARLSEARAHIIAAQQLLQSELTALVGESYHRAYRATVQVQQLAELEEILLHKADPEAMPLPLLLSVWRGRLLQAERSADVWQEILSVRALVAPPARDPQTWLKFSNLCRKSGRGALGHKILSEILGEDWDAHWERMPRQAAHASVTQPTSPDHSPSTTASFLAGGAALLRSTGEMTSSAAAAAAAAASAHVVHADSASPPPSRGGGAGACGSGRASPPAYLRASSDGTLPTGTLPMGTLPGPPRLPPSIDGLSRAGGGLSGGLGGDRAYAGGTVDGAQRHAGTYGYLKQMWADGSREEAIARLATFARYEAAGTAFAAKAWRRLGGWQRAVGEDQPFSVERAATVLASLGNATDASPHSYKAWHAWAMVSFEAVQQLPPSDAAEFVVALARGQNLGCVPRLHLGCRSAV